MFNLVNTAESVSPSSKQLIFIIAKREKLEHQKEFKTSISKNYKRYKEMFDVIDAVKMEIEDVIKELLSTSLPASQTLKNYGFFKLDIWNKHIAHWKKQEPLSRPWRQRWLKEKI